MPAPRSRRPDACFSIPCLVALAAACSGLACGGAPPDAAGQKAPVAPARPAPSAAAVITCAIDGTVRDEKGLPVEGALVTVMPPHTPKEAARGRTKRDGSFCVGGVPPGEYGLTVTSLAATSAYVDVFPVGEAGAHGVEVRAGGEGFVLRGRVTDAAGRPAPGRTLRIPRASNFAADVFLVEADAAGGYAVRLPPGAYGVMIADEDAAAALPLRQLDRDLTVDVVAAPLNPRDKPAPDAVVDWVKKNAVPLATAEAGHGTDDLEPLRAVVGGARVVALGEATHGTREFFQMKHRMLEFLVEKMGFRTFAIEASFPEALVADEYVRTGKGDPHAAVAAMRFWTWDTEEVVEMVRWMRRYNEEEAHKEKLRFFGVDMQSPAGSASAVAGALSAIDRKLGEEVARELEPIDDDWNADQVGEAVGRDGAADGRLDRAGATAKKVVARFDERRDADVKKLGAEGWALARIHAHVVADFVEMTRKRGSDFGVRDRAMAANTLRLLEMLGSTGKMVLWAHNAHVQRSEIDGQSTMGHALAERLGAELAVIGFAFDQGAFQAIEIGNAGRGLTDVTVGPAPAGSFDGTLARAGLPLFALDLRAAAGEVREWLRTPTFARTAGSMWNPASPDAHLHLSPPAERFDAVIFVGKSTAARATATGKRPKTAKKPPLASLTNGGFEEGDAGAAAPSWVADGHPRNLRYKATIVEKAAAHGKRAALFEREPTSMAAGIGSLTQTIDAKPMRGRRARLTARMKVEAKGIGDEAYLVLRCGSGELKTSSVEAPASKGWRESSVEIDVPASAEVLVIAVITTGAARVGIDDVSIGVIEGSK